MDVVVAPLSIQPVREVVMDYTEAYYNEYTTVLAKFPEDAATKWKLYISPFKWQVRHFCCTLTSGFDMTAVPTLRGILVEWNIRP